MSLRRTVIVFLSIAGAAVPSARADDVKHECVDAATNGQTKRDEGKLLAARDLMMRCARDECTVVKAFCARWLTEIEGQIPSVVVRVVDSDGSDRTDAKATMDGRPMRLDGKPMSLDPGEHRLVVEAPDAQRKEQKVLLVDREKSRLVSVQLPSKKRGQAAAADTRSSAPPQKEGIPTGVWILGGIGVAAVGTGVYFGLTARHQLNELQNNCSPMCPESSTKSGRRDALLADIGFGVGGAAIVSAILWGALSGGASPAHQASLPRLDVEPIPSGWFATTSFSY
jgi:hypothetical protein